MANIRGLLGAIAELPGVINQGLLGPLPMDPQMEQIIGSGQVAAQRKSAVNDLALRFAAGQGLGAVPQAQQGFQGRVFDILKQQEMARMLAAQQQQQQASAAYTAGLSPQLQQIAGVAGAPAVAEAQLAEMSKPPPQPTDDIQEYQYAVSQGFKGSFQDWQLARARASATKVDVNTAGPPGLSDYAKKSMELAAPQLAAYQEQAGKAVKTVRQIDATLAASQKGLTGMLAPGALGATAFLRSFGIELAPEVISDTRAFESAVNQNIIAWMANMGGARGFSEKESLILKDAFPKLIDSPAARKQILNLMRDRAAEDHAAAVEGVQRTQRQLQDLQTGGFGIEAPPPMPAPPGSLPRIKGDADYNALPSGTEFIGPDGKRRRKP